MTFLSLGNSNVGSNKFALIVLGLHVAWGTEKPADLGTILSPATLSFLVPHSLSHTKLLLFT